MGVPFYYMLYSPHTHTQFTWDECYTATPTQFTWGIYFPSALLYTPHSCIASSITGILYHYRKKFSQRFDVVHFAKT